MKGTKPLVCFVESDELHRELLKAILAKRGFKVCAFNSGSKLLNFLDADGSKLKPLFILIDVSAQGIAGFEAARRLVARPGAEDIPIIMMAKHCGMEDRHEAQSAGAITCLPKPVSLESIEAELKKVKVRKESNRSILRDSI